MTDRDPPALDSLPVDGPAPTTQPSPGAQLRAARESLKLTAPDIAARLHLDLRVIESLEADRYEDLRVPAYVCGYLRSYGRQVGLDGDSLVRAYETRSGSVLPPPLHPFRSRPSAQTDTTHSAVRLASLAVALAVLGLAFVWWTARDPAPGEAPIVAELPPDTPPPPPVAGQAESAGAAYRYPMVQHGEGEAVDATGASGLPTLPGLAVSPTGADGSAYTPPAEGVDAAAATSEAVPGAAAAVEAVDPSVQAPPAPPAGPLPAADTGGNVSVTIGLSAPSWVEVYDASDRRLFFNMGSAGQTIATRGTGPLRVIIGNIRAARLSVEGQDVPLLPLAREGVARLLVTQGGAEPLPRPGQ